MSTNVQEILKSLSTDENGRFSILTVQGQIVDRSSKWPSNNKGHPEPGFPVTDGSKFFEMLEIIYLLLKSKT